jgi:ribosomal protein S26
MGRRVGKARKGVTGNCPACGHHRAHNHRHDGQGKVIELKCRSCGNVYPNSEAARVLRAAKEP